MKKIFFVTLLAFVFASCGLFHHANKNGCPSNGRNIGAEKLLSGDPKAIKLANKASKLKGGDKFNN